MSGLSIKEREELAELRTLLAHPGFARLRSALEDRFHGRIREFTRENADGRDELAGEARGLRYALDWTLGRVESLSTREDT